ncbi:MAG TPA: hypothetical protein VFN20_09765, partial [Candidatus Acidoferrum sp.]|nr:hypothetical protein [Candidatus Acidoferrum sp.]
MSKKVLHTSCGSESGLKLVENNPFIDSRHTQFKADPLADIEFDPLASVARVVCRTMSLSACSFVLLQLLTFDFELFFRSPFTAVA